MQATVYVCALIGQKLCFLPDGNFKLLLCIKQKSAQFFVWLIKANEQNLLHIRDLVTQKEQIHQCSAVSKY